MKKPVFNDNVLNIVGVNGRVKQKLAKCLDINKTI